MSQALATASSATQNGFNTRLLWPDMVRTPENSWSSSCKEIVDKLGTNPHKAHDTKKRMEKCLMYFYVMRKNLKLFDHTYTAACILFFRYWYVFGLPPTLPDCIHLSQALLVTSCKTMENNRPIDAFVKGTCDFLMKDIPTSRGRQNIEKLRWDLRDKLVSYEKQVLCQMGFDLNLHNPKELIEEIFSGYFRYNRDFDMSENFKKVFPKIIQEARNFIIQAGTQPVSLLCDGYTFTVLSLIFCGLQYKKNVDTNFRFPKNFFSDRFPVKVVPQQFVSLFTDYRILEENFFDLKSNKGEKLQITTEEINDLIEEEGDDLSDEEQNLNPYVYEHIKSGIVRKELLDHIELRIKELYKKAQGESNSSEKRPFSEVEQTEDHSKKRKI